MKATGATHRHTAIFRCFNRKHVSDFSRNRLVTFGTLLALLKCVTATGKTAQSPREKEQSDESQDEHEGRQRTVGQLSSTIKTIKQSDLAKANSQRKEQSDES